MTASEPYRPKFGFDIRIRPPPEEKAASAAARCCEWHGCQREANYRAPHSRERLSEHRWFCLEHVRAFNGSWNFFEGLSEDEIRAFQAGSVTGHRPTWKLGSTGSAGSGFGHHTRSGLGHFSDAFGLFARGGVRHPAGGAETRQRQLTARQARAFEVFDMEQAAGKDAIRSQFKILVKRFHPDAHGGDKDMEARLREVIEAYQVLRNGGFC